MTLLDKVLTGIAVLSLTFGGLTLVGCEDEGPFERTGDRIDDGIDDAGDELEDVGDDIEDSFD